MKSSNNGKFAVERVERLVLSNSVESDLQYNDSRYNYKKKDSNQHQAGRPNSLDEFKLSELLRLYYSKPYSFRELADIFGVSRMTVWRAVQTTQTLVTMK